MNPNDVLAQAFGAEYDALDMTERNLLADDLHALCIDEDASMETGARALARRVGRGNLSSYLDCLKAGQKRAQPIGGGA